MFAELKSNEDIQKSIVEYLEQNVEDITRIKFTNIYMNIPFSFVVKGGIVAYHKVEYDSDIKMRVFHCDWFIVPEIFFKYIQEDMFYPGQWQKHYLSGCRVGSGFVSSCCDKWSQRDSKFCPDCGRMMKSYIKD